MCTHSKQCEWRQLHHEGSTVVTAVSVTFTIALTIPVTSTVTSAMTVHDSLAIGFSTPDVGGR